MVMDSLRYWATAFNVDGFRFDLGVTLGREGHGFDPGSGFFDAIRQDPILNTRKMISEPWDIGPDGYQVGNHPVYGPISQPVLPARPNCSIGDSGSHGHR